MRNYNYILTVCSFFLFGALMAQDPNWEDNFVAQDYENSATIAAAQVWIDGVEQTTGKLAIFYSDEVRGVDSDGASFFPPGGTNIYEISVWSNELSGETMTFQFYDDVNDVVIDLNETYDFIANDIVGDGFSPFQLTGTLPDGGGDDDAGDCVTGDPLWEDNFVAQDYENSATIAAAQVWLDGVEQTTGKLAIFYSDEVRGVDSDGASFFPPGGTNIYEISVWSNELSGETMTFQFYDDVNDVVIELNETYDFIAQDIVGDGFSPFQLTGTAPDCDDAPCDDADADGICDDVDDCVGEYDECGECNGDGIDEGACDCDGNVVDECGECGGDGIDEGACDCDGNVEDECGECGGDNSSCSGCTDPLANNYDDNATIDDGSCVYDTGPAAFAFTQSSSQAFYYVFNLNIQADEGNGFPQPLDSEDWLGAFKDLDGDGTGDVCVGAKKWDTSQCGGGFCDIALMGVDSFNPDDTENYMEDGDIPVFMVYDQSENAFYDAKTLSSDGYYFEAIDFPWSANGVQLVQEVGVRYDCNVELGGHAFTDYCDYCVEGSTDLEENFSDLGCGCDNDAPLTYCLDTDTDENGNPGTDSLYCLSDETIDCSSDSNDLWDDSDDSENFCYDNVPLDWYLDCNDECIYDNENDADGDDICGDVDECPYDENNDWDGDNICGDVDACPDDYQNDADGDGICNCTLGDDADCLADEYDDCPYDDENDADDDGICGDVDACPYDDENDADSDGICGDVDECPYDDENDADDDGICGDVDACPYDYYNDADNDGQCGNEDECPWDAEDDADDDGLCGDVDECDYDYNNDWDNDGICGDVDACPNDQNNDLDGDDQCDCTLDDLSNCQEEVDSCPNDYWNDIDGDGYCADVDNCPYDDLNDIDGDGECDCTLEDQDDCPYEGDECPFDEDNDIDDDGICGDVDDCPNDNENDIDGDGICGDVDECPYDFYNDADDDGQCGDVDPCPWDENDDWDNDGICGDVDGCPNDDENDADGDGICDCSIDDENCQEQVDDCPYDDENDADNDEICGDVDDCPYDFENDADDDGICGDVDACPYDDENDADGDDICGDVDICPYDDENDADQDGICGDVDICSYDPDNDSDGDGLCCSDQDGDGVNDDTGQDYFGDDVEGGASCDCATNYFDCASDCVDPASDDADTIDDCGTCDDTDWNYCEAVNVDLHDNANLSSFYVLPDDTSLDNIFQDVSENILAVAGASSAAIYEDGWSGTLENLDQKAGYWIVMSGEDVLSILGTPIDPQTNYSLDIGDNLIGYPLNYNTLLLDGLSEQSNGSLVAIFGEGISAYNYDGAGYWIGSLQYFTPNSGYWFLSNDAFDFSYQSGGDLGRTASNYNAVPKYPVDYEYYQSKQQAFYYIENVEGMMMGDWVLAYNNDILVGARQYNGAMIDVPVMGSDNTDFTVNYCEFGDVPEFKLYRPSTGMLNNLSGSISEWANHNISVLNNLSLTDMPVELTLDRAYPNPFNPSTSLSYSIPSDGSVQLSVYDINGRLVEHLVDSYQNAGNYNTMWNASNISSGVYFVRLTAASNVLTQKVMLIK